MTHTPTRSTVSDRQHKADILAAVLAYIAARDCDVPYRFLPHEIADQFGTDVDDIQLEVMHALSALGSAGAVEISTADPDGGNGISFGADTTLRANGAIRGFTLFERRPDADCDALDHPSA